MSRGERIDPNVGALLGTLHAVALHRGVKGARLDIELALKLGQVLIGLELLVDLSDLEGRRCKALALGALGSLEAIGVSDFLGLVLFRLLGKRLRNYPHFGGLCVDRAGVITRCGRGGSRDRHRHGDDDCRGSN